MTSVFLLLAFTRLGHERQDLWSPCTPGLDPRVPRGAFSKSSHTIDLNIDTPVATLPGAWRDRVGAGTGWPGVSIL